VLWPDAHIVWLTGLMDEMQIAAARFRRNKQQILISAWWQLPVMRIPLCTVTLGDREASYVHEAVSSGWISGTGRFVDAFEHALELRIGRAHALAVNSATSALELCLLALGIGPGDEVLVPALTFAAPASAVLAVGAIPVLCDIDDDSWTIDVAQARTLTTHRSKAVIGVDLLGHPCDFDALAELNLPIIEDAAHAHGARYHGRSAGSLGLLSVLSFHANKAITTGEGGCVLTDDSDLADAVRVIANHGMRSSRPYYHEVVGRNYRMTNITAAVGLAQVERWDELIAGRAAVASQYGEFLAGAQVSTRPVAQWAEPSWWLYVLHSEHRDRLVSLLRDQQIDARALWPSLDTLPVFSCGVRAEYPTAQAVSRSTMWLPTWHGMRAEVVAEVADAVKAILSVLSISRLT
jgi:perosamine synthetase